MTILEHRCVGLVWYWIITISNDTGQVLVKIMDVILERAIRAAADGILEEKNEDVLGA